MEEKYGSLRGMYRDVLKDKSNNIIFDSGWVSNTIVKECRVLLAALMNNYQANQPSGIKYLRVGEGNENWDDLDEYPSGPPEPYESDTTSLEAPHPSFSIEVGSENLSIEYLDESGEKADGPSKQLQITATLGVNQPSPKPGKSTYPLREFGLFGVVVDDNNFEHEYMINCIRHPVIHKDVSATLIREVRLYF